MRLSRTVFCASWLRNTAVYLSGGFVLFFASERLFWSTFRAGDKLGELIVTWLLYSGLACVFVNVIARFQVGTTARMFLAGALYGWLTEGAVVGTLYGTEASAPFPLSIVWTGLSWHALISVLVCWHFLGRALRNEKPWPTLAWATGLGVFWGLWATFLWRETPPEVSALGSFAAHAYICAALLMLSQLVLLKFPAVTIRPGWPGLVLALLGLGIFYSAQVKALGWRPLLVLPPLIGVVLGLLWGSRSRGVAAGELLVTSPLARRNLLGLLAMPSVALAVYGGQLAAETKGIAPIHFYRVTGFLSVAMLVWSVYRAARTRNELPPGTKPGL